VAALTRESNAPAGLGFITTAGLSLGIVVVGLSILDRPIEVVVRDVGVIYVLPSVAPAVGISGGDGNQSEKNNSDL